MVVGEGVGLFDAGGSPCFRSIVSVRAEPVLVVDDEERIRSLVGSYLRAEGFAVDEAATGEGALAKMRERHPDLVILDVRLPRLDGFEVLRDSPGGRR